MSGGGDLPYPLAVRQFPKLRQSRLSTFQQCSLLARFDEEYRSHWSGHPQGRGQIFHRFAAKALALMAELGETQIDQEVALAILRECLRQHDVPDEEVVNVPFDQVKDLRWVVVKWAHDNEFDIEFLADIEQRIDVEIEYENPEGGRVPRIITGALDALFIPEPDWAVVIDWKDSWSLPPKTDLSNRGYFQQRFYAYLVMRRYQAIERVTLREHYVRYSESREATVFRTELPDIEEELAALVERWDRTWEHGKWPLNDGEEPKLFTPSPGAHCVFCPRPASCPIFPAARVEGAITNEETAERWAAEQIVAKAAVNQRDKALKAWAGSRGPIPVKHAKDPNRVLGYRESTRTKRPTKEELETALAQHGAGLQVEDLYEVSKTSRFDQHSRVDAADSPDDADLMNALDESLKQQQEGQ
jgi:hypothetical protein